MKGWIVTRQTKDGKKRYDACWRVGAAIKSKTFARRADADAYLTSVVRSLQDGTYALVRPALMDEVFARWLESEVEVRLREGTLRPSTAKAYRSMVEQHLRPAFGKYRSDRLTLEAVEAWRARLAEQIAAGRMAPKFYANLRNLLHAILAWARHPHRRYLSHDPLEGLPRLNVPRAKRRAHYEPHQLAAMLAEAAKTPPDDTIIKTALLSGLRRGELFALKWADVDWDGRLHVRHSIYQGAITAPKTEDSDRVVDVPQRLLDDLAVYQAMYPPIGEGFMFRQASGRPMDPDRWHRERFVPILKRAGLYRPGAGLHALRHTYVSLLIAQGADVGYIADQVGHSTTRLTQDVYRHVFRAVRLEAMRRLEAAIPSSTHPAKHHETAGTGGSAAEPEC